MRSPAALLVFILFLTTRCVVGAEAASGAAVGAQLGVDRSGVDGDVPPNTEYINKTGLIAGLQGEISFGDRLSLSLQPSFIQKRTAVSIASSTRGGTPTELPLSFDYFSVPVLVKFAKAGGRTYVAGGITVDFMTSATLSGQGSDRDVMSTFNSTGVGAVLGFGVVFPLGHTRLTTEVRFVQGLTNLAGGAAAEANGALASRLHSNGLELIVGDLLPLGRR
jgi:Outer membrane protein beta-barrel domain